LFSAPLAASANEGRVLVLLDSLSMQETHRKFLQIINERGYNTTVATIDAKSLAFKDWDEWLFDKLVILGGNKSKSLLLFSVFIMHTSRSHLHPLRFLLQGCLRV
jgi:hypothetical protein